MAYWLVVLLQRTKWLSEHFVQFADEHLLEAKLFDHREYWLDNWHKVFEHVKVVELVQVIEDEVEDLLVLMRNLLLMMDDEELHDNELGFVVVFDLVELLEYFLRVSLDLSYRYLDEHVLDCIDLGMNTVEQLDLFVVVAETTKPVVFVEFVELKNLHSDTNLLLELVLMIVLMVVIVLLVMMVVVVDLLHHRYSLVVKQVSMHSYWVPTMDFVLDELSFVRELFDHVLKHFLVLNIKTHFALHLHL